MVIKIMITTRIMMIMRRRSPTLKFDSTIMWPSTAFAPALSPPAEILLAIAVGVM
jgi:hypothetical protein